MNSHYTLTVTLTLEGPLLTSGSEMSDVGVDAPLARDRYGRFMFPYSLIKGKVLDALRDLKTDESWVKKWMGNKPNNGNYDPERGRLRFGDFCTSQPGQPDNVIERINLDADTRAVAGQMLLMIQAPFNYGEQVNFKGEIEFLASDEESTDVEQRLKAAFHWVSAFGAYRTVGFGRTRKVEVALSRTIIRSTGFPAASTAIPWQLKLDRPLCLVGRRHSQNHFESMDVISGTVLKGAVANMLQELAGTAARDVTTGSDFLKLREHFTAIRFSEVRPREIVKNANSPRPVEPPLSIVTSPVTESGDLPYFDVALEREPQLISGAAPAFMPDWKDTDFGIVRGAFGWPMLPRERRTRTAIDEVTGRAADQQLFSYGLVLPDRGKWVVENDCCCVTEQYAWEGHLGMEGVREEDREEVRNDLAKLLACGLVGLGKTRAVGEITWLDELPPSAVTTDSHRSGDAETSTFVIFTLQTECLMTNPDTLMSDKHDDPLRAAYEEFWSDISNNSLQLERFFARQSLYGGFVSKRSNNGKYEPFLLTDRGSLFVLSIRDKEQVQKLLDQWHQQGLCSPQWVKSRYASDGHQLWQRCPYIRENGYGEVAINLACHVENRIPSELKTTGAMS